MKRRAQGEAFCEVARTDMDDRCLLQTFKSEGDRLSTVLHMCVRAEHFFNGIRNREL